MNCLDYSRNILEKNIFFNIYFAKNNSRNHKCFLVYHYFCTLEYKFAHICTRFYTAFIQVLFYTECNFAKRIGDNPRKEKNGRQAKDKEKGNKEEGRKEEEEEIISSNFCASQSSGGDPPLLCH